MADRDLIERLAAEIILRMEGRAECPPIPAGVSSRHVHLSREDLCALFGEGYVLTKLRDLSQTGQFAANETLCLVGPRGTLGSVRVLGPVREKSQVEVSRTDAFLLGIAPPLRISGDTSGGANVLAIGPKGSLELRGSVIIAKRHIHMSPEDSLMFSVQDGDLVDVRGGGERGCLFYDTVVRVTPDSVLEFHLDTDEANAAGISSGTWVQLVRDSAEGKL